MRKLYEQSCNSCGAFYIELEYDKVILFKSGPRKGQFKCIEKRKLDFGCGSKFTHLKLQTKPLDVDVIPIEQYKNHSYYGSEVSLILCPICRAVHAD